MTRLPNDAMRCLGRADRESEAGNCPHRQTCARQASIEQDYKQIGAGPYPYVMVTNMRSPDGLCRHYIEVSE